MGLNSGIRDNHKRGNVGDFLTDNITENSNLSFVSAYFTIYAYQVLKENLDKVNRLRFLFGQPRFISEIDPNKTDSRSYQIEDDTLTISLKNRLMQSQAAKECSEWIKEKVDIKSMVKPNFLHGKLYHITQENGVEKAIMGSSNFTVNGLGMGSSPNIELNMEVSDDRDRRDLLQWFEDVWNAETNLVRDVKNEVLKYLEQLYANNPPEFVYYKTLYHLFEKYIGEQDETKFFTSKTGFFDSGIWNKLYSFQKDGVRGAINKLEKHNGCIIADSVGLGKTYEALAIIKYYESLNYRVLLICPKKLKENWTLYQAQKNNKNNPFKQDRFSYHVIYHTDLGRVSGESDADNLPLAEFNWGAYDLIVIDESHNLRGNPKQKMVNGESTYNRTMFLMEKVIKSGAKSKILMLSATPVNTSLKDLRNQIHFITQGCDKALYYQTGIENISYTLNTTQKQFVKWVKDSRGRERNVNELFSVLDKGFFKLLDELTIARSRKHIVKFYSGDDFGSFPKRLPPDSEYPDIDLKKRFYSYDKVNDEILKYSLSLFNPFSYLKDEHKHLYEASQDMTPFTQEGRERTLIGMMKMNFMKRLESSVYSFRLTMQRTLQKIEDLEEKIQAYQKNQNELFDVEKLFTFDDGEEMQEDGDFDELQEDFTVGKKLKYNLAHLDLEKWLEDLAQDKDQLMSLYNAAESVRPENDAKLDKLKKIIENKIDHPINPDNKKVLIFTAFADTAEYLYEHLHQWLKEKYNLHSAIVTGGSINKTTLQLSKNTTMDFSSILTNFAPIAKERARLENQPEEEISLLIGTDCISEGQNLQDCDLVINYDIHWNPVRIIQRYGRIDRLNGLNDKIKMINFWPTEDLDKYMNLKQRVEARMVMVDLTGTGVDDVISKDDINDLASDEMRFRTKQLKKLKKEVIDLEDMDDNISLTDFNLDDFRIDLMNYLKANEPELREAPLGIYGVAASPHHKLWKPSQRLSLTDEQKKVMRPGVVFCLKHCPDGKELEKLNPLHPYFLIYLQEDGDVRFNFGHAKQILELLRVLCMEKSYADEAIYDVFEENTKNGTDMQKYDALIQKAIKSITDTIGKKSIDLLTRDRGMLIPQHETEQKNEFELVTWLVII